MSDEQHTPPDYTRYSFTMRKMLPWQIWTLAGVVVVLLVIALIYYA